MVSSPSSSENHRKMKSSPTTTPSPLRRSQRQRDISSNSKSEAKEKDEETFSNRKDKIMDARKYRTILAKNKNKGNVCFLFYFVF